MPSIAATGAMCTHSDTALSVSGTLDADVMQPNNPMKPPVLPVTSTSPSTAATPHVAVSGTPLYLKKYRRRASPTPKCSANIMPSNTSARAGAAAYMVCFKLATMKRPDKLVASMTTSQRTQPMGTMHTKAIGMKMVRL